MQSTLAVPKSCYPLGALAPSLRELDLTKSKTEGVDCDTIGQKYGRLASLGAVAILPISSCSSRPFIVHRTRGTMNQLTAALRLWKHSFRDWVLL